MPPKKRTALLPKDQTIDLNKIAKEQEQLKKKRTRKTKVKLDAPLRDANLKDPQLYIRNLEGDVTDYTGGQGAYFPAQYIPSGQFFHRATQNTNFVPDESGNFSNSFDNMDTSSLISSIPSYVTDSEDEKNDDISMVTNNTTVSSDPINNFFNPLNMDPFAKVYQNELMKEKRKKEQDTSMDTIRPKKKGKKESRKRKKDLNRSKERNITKKNIRLG